MGNDETRITIEETDGDSPWVGSVPGFLRGMARTWDTRNDRHRDSRMVRAVGRLYPAVCEAEKKALDEGRLTGRPRLHGVAFERAVNDDRAIERGLAVFDEAWQAGAITLRAANGKLIPPHRGKVIVPACGYSVDHVRHYFIDRAARLILRRIPKVYERLAVDTIEPGMLPRLRRIGAIRPQIVEELLRGFEGNVRRALLETDDAVLDALIHIPAPVLSALRKSLETEFQALLNKDPEVLRAVADSFTVPEQVQDLGQGILLMDSPDAIRAIGQWDIRDVTDRVNEDREKRGMPPIAGPVHSTDIRVMRGLLGNEFNHLLEFPAPLLKVFGQSVRETRDLDLAKRQNRVEQMTLFCQRYINYFTNEQAILALFLLNPEDLSRVPAAMRPSIPDVFFILEGLWGKKGYGRKFFETVMGTDEGAKSLRLMMYDFVGLKERGSVKTPEDLEQIVTNSDLLDGHIAKYMASK